jgi:drug/metabolite transporter (DMT)-like permease
MPKQASTGTLTLLIAIAMIGWGGSWTTGKIASGLSPPEIIIFWRFLITTVSLIPLLVWLRVSLKVSKGTLLQLALSSLLLTAYNVFFLTGVRLGYAGAGGVLVTSLNPVMTFGWTALFLRKRPSLFQAVGLVLGFSGGAIILQIWDISYAQLLDSGNLFFLLAPCTWSLLTVLSHKVQEKVSFMTFSFYVYLFSTLLSVPLALMHGFWPVTDQYALLWLNIAYLALVATSFGATVYFFATRRLGSQRSSSFTFLIPVSAVLISWALLNEVPKVATVIGGALSISAVYLINIRSNGS